MYSQEGLTRFVRLARGFTGRHGTSYCPSHLELLPTSLPSAAETLPKQIVCRDTSPMTSGRLWHWAVTVARVPGYDSCQRSRTYGVFLWISWQIWRAVSAPVACTSPWASSSRQWNRRLNGEPLSSLPLTSPPASPSLFSKVESFKEMNAGRCSMEQVTGGS